MPHFNPPFVPLDASSLADAWASESDAILDIPPAPPRADWPVYDTSKPGRWDPSVGTERFAGETDFAYEYRLYHAAVYWANEDATGADVVKRARGRPPVEAYPGEPADERRKRQLREAGQRFRARSKLPESERLLELYREAVKKRDDTYMRMNEDVNRLLAEYEASLRAAGGPATV